MPGGSWLAFATLLVIFLAKAHAKLSPECPNGCIIASIVVPQRKCECVVPTCDAKSLLQATASESVDPSELARHASELAALDCDFCSRDSFTYTSFEDCYAADLAFKPVGRSIDRDSYASLEKQRGRDRRSKGPKRAAEEPAEVAAEVAAGGAVAEPVEGNFEDVLTASSESLSFSDDVAAANGCPAPPAPGCPVSVLQTVLIPIPCLAALTTCQFRACLLPLLCSDHT
jgi:hypothetical protein